MVSRMCNNTLRVFLAFLVFALNWKTKNERVSGMARFCMNLGLCLLIIATGTESKEFALGCAGGRKPDRA